MKLGNEVTVNKKALVLKPTNETILYKKVIELEGPTKHWKHLSYEISKSLDQNTAMWSRLSKLLCRSG